MIQAKRKNRINYNKNISDKLLTVSEPTGLLNFLLLNISGKSRNNIKSLLSHREVTVDGTVITQYDYMLKEGQRVCIKAPAPGVEKNKNEPDIIYEDDEFIAINKPVGLVTVSTEKEKENTAYQMITEYVRRRNAKNRIFVVHRLDRETSGVLLFAKNEKIKLALQAGWSDLVTDREYIAVVEGELKDKSGTVKSWLRQTRTLLMYSSSKPGDGLEAVTNYCVQKETSEYSLVDIHLETGRKNQIRVHMKDIGHSVTGDKKYGAENNPLKRMGLHACKLELKHPYSGILMSFEAPVPESFIKLFNKLI